MRDRLPFSDHVTLNITGGRGMSKWHTLFRRHVLWIILNKYLFKTCYSEAS